MFLSIVELYNSMLLVKYNIDVILLFNSVCIPCTGMVVKKKKSWRDFDFFSFFLTLLSSTFRIFSKSYV